MSLRPIPPILTVAALAACGSANAQTPPASQPAEPHMYEVSPEHAEALARAAQEQQGFLEVSGTARITVPADLARVTFSVETEGATASEASAANADLMSAVLAAVRSTDAPGLEVETRGYALNPEYVRTPESGRRPRIDGYRAVNNVVASTTDTEGVGRLIDAAIGAGANRVASLVFEASDTDEARREALALAVSRARSEARAMAEALGVELGPPLEVRGGANVPGPSPQFGMVMAQRASDTPVEPAGQDVTASVTIKYGLGSR